MAFANVYKDFFNALLEQISGNDPAPYLELVPSAADGVSTLKLIDGAMRSHEAERAVGVNS